ncbi:hypothetical protein [Arundinibacter roseus]|uniref:Uncharacterized protein n=1 Tax=Arundinibacter roseus TaxID=2070510 RepID=A0A4R4KA74_9BACT|nr:hypothetical protein [Arundinibacter roseus]TDB63446.1 hypothetical protein EZE20_16935 [Arundinibacter roseus]
MRLVFIGLALAATVGLPGFGQQRVSPSDPVPSGRVYAQALYDSAVVETQHLYNGPQYFIYASREKEHQFLGSREWQMGSVRYDGQQFDSIPILFDIALDQVVINYVKGFGQVRLQNEKIDYFTLPGHRFVRVVAGQDSFPGLRSTGFYDVVYGGPTRLLVRRIKERQERIEETRVLAEFPYKEFFYVYHQNSFHIIRSKKALLTLLGDQKKALKKFSRENHLKFKKNREAALLATVAHYDQLTRL